MMATCQLLHTRQKKSSKESVLFPNKIDTKKQSVVLVKRLLAISVSCITYLRGLFPESSYGTRYLDDLCLKILREDKSCLGSFQIVKWIQGCFDALERQYLHIAVLAIYTNPKEPETVTELYQFKFKYKKEAPQMDIISNKMNFVNGVCSEDIKQASSLLIRKLYLLMQNLGPLPNDITLTMKLFYYNEVTPKDYQPPGFKEEVSPADLLFDGDPVNLKVGSVSTGFHTMKVKVTTENKRMGRVESNLIQKNGPTEISHQGLDYDEEEEEGSTKDNPLPVRADSGEPEKDKNDTRPGWRTEASSFCLQDTGGKEKTEIEEKGRMPSSRASQQRSEGTTGEPLDQPACSKQAARDLVQSHPSISKDGDSTTSLDKLCQLITLIVKKSFSISCLNLVFSQEEVIGPKKKRKVSEPEKLLLEGRK